MTHLCYRNYDGYQVRHQISKEELENVLSLKTTFTEATMLSISRQTFYKLLQDYNIPALIDLTASVMNN